MNVLVPEHRASDAEVEAVAQALGPPPWAVLTGAGVSTESGIPDYRGPGTLDRARSPMKFQSFVADPHARARYWARSVLGFARMSTVRPGAAHHAIARLESHGWIYGVVTQNVDSLHRHAGSQRVVELHGALREVGCLHCEAREDRATLQDRLLRVNPGFLNRVANMAPDGDADLDDEEIRDFRVLGCLRCGGPLKPDVVFFGENVPRERVETARSLVDAGRALLVAGTSLTVFSGLRFVKQAAAAKKPVVIVNAGPTRGDPEATLKVDARVGDLLERVVAHLEKVAAAPTP